MTHFAILRTKKLKTLGNVAASGQHNFRERETLNADESRTHLNEHFGPQSTKELTSAVSALLPEKTRKDGVLCIEYFISASPEWFKASGDEKQYFADALEWLKDRHGEQNIAGASIHRDEGTPHMVAYVVPWTRDGRMSAKEFLGGRAKLSKMQTDFARDVGAAHGLERGKEGSIARHQTVKQFYTAINNPPPQLPSVRAAPQPLGEKTFAEKNPFSDAAKERKKKEEEYEKEHELRYREMEEALAMASGVIEALTLQAQGGIRYGEQLKAERAENERLKERLSDINELKAENRARRIEISDLKGQIVEMKGEHAREKEVAVEAAVEAAKASLRAKFSAWKEKQDKEMAEMRHELAEIYKQTAVMMKHTISPEQLKEALGVDMSAQNSKADVFDVLVKQGKAKDFRGAVELVAKVIPASENGAKWSELAEWVLDYEKAQEAQKTTSTGRIQGEPSRFARPPVIDEGTASLGGLMGVKGPRQAAEQPERPKQGRSM